MYIRINQYCYRRVFSICDYETNIILENRAEKTLEEFQNTTSEIEFKIMKFNFMIDHIIGSYNMICEMIKSGMITKWSHIMYSMLCIINDELAYNTTISGCDELDQIEFYEKSMLTHLDIIEKIQTLSKEYTNAKRDAILRTRLPSCIMREIDSF